MALVLAIEPDARQAAALRRVVRQRVGAELILVDSKDAAVAALAAATPDLILLTALLSPRDEEELVAHLRTLPGADHVQTLTIPFLAPASGNGRKRSTGLFRFRRQTTGPTEGCDPATFGNELLTYLRRSEEIRNDAREREWRRKATDAAPVSELPPDASAEAAAPLAEIELRPEAELTPADSPVWDQDLRLVATETAIDTPPEQPAPAGRFALHGADPTDASTPAAWYAPAVSLPPLTAASVTAPVDAAEEVEPGLPPEDRAVAADLEAAPPDLAVVPEEVAESAATAHSAATEERHSTGPAGIADRSGDEAEAGSVVADLHALSSGLELTTDAPDAALSEARRTFELFSDRAPVAHETGPAVPMGEPTAEVDPETFAAEQTIRDNVQADVEAAWSDEPIETAAPAAPEERFGGAAQLQEAPATHDHSVEESTAPVAAAIEQGDVEAPAFDEPIEAAALAAAESPGAEDVQRVAGVAGSAEALGEVGGAPVEAPFGDVIQVGDESAATDDLITETVEAGGPGLVQERFEDPLPARGEAAGVAQSSGEPAAIRHEVETSEPEQFEIERWATALGVTPRDAAIEILADEDTGTGFPERAVELELPVPDASVIEADVLGPRDAALAISAAESAEVPESPVATSEAHASGEFRSDAAAEVPGLPPVSRPEATSIASPRGIAASSLGELLEAEIEAFGKPVVDESGWLTPIRPAARAPAASKTDAPVAWPAAAETPQEVARFEPTGRASAAPSAIPSADTLRSGRADESVAQNVRLVESAPPEKGRRAAKGKGREPRRARAAARPAPARPERKEARGDRAVPAGPGSKLLRDGSRAPARRAAPSPPAPPQEPALSPAALSRLAPLAMWVRMPAASARRPANGDGDATAPVEPDPWRDLLAGLALPPDVAFMAHPSGCRIRRVRVARPKGRKRPSKASRGPVVILSPELLAKPPMAEDEEQQTDAQGLG